MAKYKFSREEFRVMQRVTLFLFVICPIFVFLMLGLFFYLDSVSQNSEPFKSESLFYIIVGLFVAVSIVIPIIAWIIKARRNKKKEKREQELAEIFIQQALMKYLSQFPDKNKQEFLNYLAQCPEEKRQEILLKILREYGMSSERK